MAKRLSEFTARGPGAPRRYPWDQWTDGSAWEIRKGEDYDVLTENMRVNLHMRASSEGKKVRTRKIADKSGEGLVFQFYAPEEPEGAIVDDGDDVLIEALLRDALGIYEQARAEVTILRKDGTRQAYAPVRYREQILRGHERGELVKTVEQIVSKATDGFARLEQEGRLDLLLECLVIDPERPYHKLFSEEAVRNARSRLSSRDHLAEG